MWKKVNNGVATQPEFASQPEPKTLPSAGKSLNESPFGPLEVVGGNEDRLSTTASMAIYLEAVNEFTKNAIAWIGFLPLISKARDGHEQAATSERAASQGAGRGRGTSSNGHDAIGASDQSSRAQVSW
jgi:hypothetical protein